MSEPGTSRVVECVNCGTLNRISDSNASGKTAVCGKCHNPLSDPPAKPVLVTDSNFSSIVENSEVPVLIDLWAAWCGPCRVIAPAIEQIAAEIKGKALVGKLDVDANPITASRFGVQSIPTLLIIKNGREVDRLIGAQPKQAILQRLQRFI